MRLKGEGSAILENVLKTVAEGSNIQLQFEGQTRKRCIIYIEKKKHVEEQMETSHSGLLITHQLRFSFRGM